MRINSKDCRLCYSVSLKFLLISLSLTADPSMLFLISIHCKKIGKDHESNSQVYEQPLMEYVWRQKLEDPLSILPRLLRD